MLTHLTYIHASAPHTNLGTATTVHTKIQLSLVTFVLYIAGPTDLKTAAQVRALR